MAVHIFVVGFFILGITGLYFSNKMEEEHQESVLALSDQDKKSYEALSNEYSWIAREDRLELAKMPEALRAPYLKTQAEDRAVKVAEAEKERRRASRDSGYDSFKRIYNAGIAANTTKDYLAAAMALGVGCSTNRISDRSLCRRVESTLDRAVASGVRVR